MFALVLGACRPSARGIKSASERKPAPEFALKDEYGRTVRLSDYRDRVVLLNFWATWCGPCRIEIPWFMEFERKHKDKGFAVVGIAMDEEGWEVVKPFAAEMQVNYRILLGAGAVADLYGGVDSLPTSFLIDRQGKIAAVHIGLVGKSVYERDLSQILDAPAADRAGGVERASVGAR